jgi:hypothetical protein
MTIGGMKIIGGKAGTKKEDFTPDALKVIKDRARIIGQGEGFDAFTVEKALATLTPHEIRLVAQREKTFKASIMSSEYSDASSRVIHKVIRGLEH